MASKINTAFEVSNSNITRNNTQNIAGTFGATNDDVFVADICPAGTLCVPTTLLPNEGYEQFDLLNGNTWRMEVAPDGTVARDGDFTGIYAFNSYDVRKAQNNRENVFAVGADMLGVELPKNAIGDFTEIIIGETYLFADGNFSTPPDTTNKYITIQNGYLTASDTEPSDGVGLYFVAINSRAMTIGARYAGFDGYYCIAQSKPSSGGGGDADSDIVDIGEVDYMTLKS